MINLKRHISYLKYVLRHKYYVYLAGRQLDVPFWILIFHDWDKFLPSEWFPYARTFYNEDGTDKDYEESPEFREAWRKHQKRNKHHWQYWLLTWDRGETQALPMSDLWVKEMITDWVGAGLANGYNDPNAWYQKNKNLMILHYDARWLVENYMYGMNSFILRPFLAKFDKKDQ